MLFCIKPNHSLPNLNFLTGSGNLRNVRLDIFGPRENVVHILVYGNTACGLLIAVSLLGMF